MQQSIQDAYIFLPMLTHSFFCPGTEDTTMTGVRKVKPGSPVELSVSVGSRVIFMSGEEGPFVT